MWSPSSGECYEFWQGIILLFLLVYVVPFFRWVLRVLAGHQPHLPARLCGPLLQGSATSSGRASSSSSCLSMWSSSSGECYEFWQGIILIFLLVYVVPFFRWVLRVLAGHHPHLPACLCGPLLQVSATSSGRASSSSSCSSKWCPSSGEKISKSPRSVHLLTVTHRSCLLWFFGGLVHPWECCGTSHQWI